MKSILENEQQKQASPEKYFLHGAHTVITGCRERLYTVINDCALVHRWYTFNARRSPGVCRTMLCSAILHKEGTHLSMEQHISQVMPDITRHAHIQSIAHQSPSSTEGQWRLKFACISRNAHNETGKTNCLKQASNAVQMNQEGPNDTHKVSKMLFPISTFYCLKFAP